jgi:two-component system, NarL family, nitrate/nitrite response regulator NarL
MSADTRRCGSGGQGVVGVHGDTHARRDDTDADRGGPSGVASLTVAVLADNEVLRRGMEGLLRSVPEVGIVHGCGTPEEFGAVLSRHSPDVVVGTVAEAAWLEGFWPELTALRVVTLLAVDPAYLDELPAYAELPVGGFLWQPCLTVASVREALRQVRLGQVPMPADLFRAVLVRPGATGPSRPGWTRLTGREREALALLVQGLSNKQIARQLSISSHGAKRLVTSIMLKLDAPNRTQAAVTAIRAGLVNDG